MSEEDDKLIRVYRNRRDEYHVQLRKGTWEKLEAEITTYSPSRNIFYRWLTVAAVLLLCIGLSIPFLFRNDNTVITHKVTDRYQYKFTPQKPVKLLPKETVNTGGYNQSTIISGNYIPENTQKNEYIIAAGREKNLHGEKNDTINNTTSEPSPKSGFIGPTKEKTIYPASRNEENIKNKSLHKWSLALSAGSNSTNASSTKYFSNHFGDPGKPEPPLTNPELPGEEYIKQKYHHRLPLSAGISVRKNISTHFAFESGLTYTYLHTDISREGISGYVGNQKLHYLGIPLKANWMFYKQGRFSVYLSGGALLEYCISANQQIDKVDMNPDINRFQASLNAAAGMQVDIGKPLSLFIEPGVAYYFDNGSEIETIRTEKPCMFNVQFGIRFTY